MNLVKIIGLLSLIASPGLPAISQTIAINRDNKTIAISTTDESSAPADIAAITIGFEVFGPDADTVTAKGGKISHAILDALKNAGVEDKSIESISQGVLRNGQYDEKAQKNEIHSMPFMLMQSWTVSVPPEAAAKVLNLAIAAGANSSGSIDWRLSDHKALQAKAAENALVKARALAEQMASGLHVKIGSLIYASNEAPDTRLYLTPKSGLHGSGIGGGMFSARAQVNAEPLEIRPKTMREEATVYAVFSIE